MPGRAFMRRAVFGETDVETCPVRHAAVFPFSALSRCHRQSPVRSTMLRSDKTIRLAVRDDAPPFSFERHRQSAGYMVDLCRKVVANIADQLKMAG